MVRKPPVEVISEIPNTDPNDILNRLAEIVRDLSEKHNIGIVLYAVQDLEGPIEIEGDRMAQAGKSAILINKISPHRAYMLGMELAKAPGLSDLVKMGIDGKVPDDSRKPETAQPKETVTIH